MLPHPTETVVLAVCADYNGHRNVKFMLRKSDVPIRTELRKLDDAVFVRNRIRAEGKMFQAVGILYTECHGDFYVFEDWSLAPLPATVS